MQVAAEPLLRKVAAFEEAVVQTLGAVGPCRIHQGLPYHIHPYQPGGRRQHLLGPGRRPGNRSGKLLGIVG